MPIRRWRKKVVPEATQKVYDFIKSNPGCTAQQIATGVGISNYRYVYQIVGSFENHGGRFPVSEDAGLFYPFDFNRCEENYWTNEY